MIKHRIFIGLIVDNSHLSRRSCGRTLLLKKDMNSNPWVYIIVTVLITSAIIIGLAILVDLTVAFSAHKYSGKMLAEYRERVRALLPGKDCGQCGYPNCTQCAEAMLRKIADSDRCPYTDKRFSGKLDEITEKLQKMMEDPTPPKKSRLHRRKKLHEND